MIIGVPKEIKSNENRVGLTEAGVIQLVRSGHKVLVQDQAGLGCNITNTMYERAGAHLASSLEDVYKQADMIVKVKEPQPSEYNLMRENQILYTFLHLAAEPELARALCERRVKAVAYETIQTQQGRLPLLTPMSEVAGRMATQVGAFLLQKDQGGKGILLGGVTGVRPGRVSIIGGGVVGTNAAKMAVGLGAQVTILDVNCDRLAYLDDVFQNRLHTLYSNVKNIERTVREADLLIGAVLLAGERAPTLVSRPMVEQMEPGSVVVDVSVDQGGCIETCRPTTHEKPTYLVGGVIHYCVSNIPGVVAHTSTYALTNVTFKYCAALAQHGLEEAVRRDPALLKGLNVYDGHICNEAVARALNQKHVPYTAR